MTLREYLATRPACTLSVWRSGRYLFNAEPSRGESVRVSFDPRGARPGWEFYHLTDYAVSSHLSADTYALIERG